MTQLDIFSWETNPFDYHTLKNLKLCPNCKILLNSWHCNECQFDIDDPRTLGYTPNEKIISILEEQDRLDIEVKNTEIVIKSPYEPWKTYTLPYVLNSYESTRTGETEIVVIKFQVDYNSVKSEDLQRLKQIDLRTRVLEYHYPESFTLQ